MQKQVIKSVAVLVGAILFDFLFFKEFPGLNVLLITIFFEGALYYFYRESFSKRAVQLVALGTFIIELGIVLTNSNFAVLAYLISFSFLVGLTQLPELRFLFFGSALYALNFLEVPRNFANSLANIPLLKRNTRWRNYILPIIMSTIVGGIFFIIYFIANPRFASATSSFVDALSRIFNFAFDLGHLIFFGVCIAITGAALWEHRLFDFTKLQNFFERNVANEQLYEEANNNGTDPHKIGIVILMTTNLLLLLNNMTDIPFVWFNQHSSFSPTEMKSFVHEGTFFLIFGILLAMGVLLWLFRRSKFDPLPEKKSFLSLRFLAIVWLIQNAFLALSVGMRNAHYINAYGLAYKRIGVIFFLVLVLSCLWFLYQKIKNKETSFWFLSRNSWSFYTVLVMVNCVPWDTFITQYNIAHTIPKDLDVRFLLNDISDKNTYQLIEKRDYLIECAKQSDVSLTGDYAIRQGADKKLIEGEFDQNLKNKIARFHRRLNYISWKSWNYPDYVNKQFLVRNGK